MIVVECRQWGSCADRSVGPEGLAKLSEELP